MPQTPHPICSVCCEPHEPGKHLSLDQMERRYILGLLELNSGKKKMTARILRIDYKTLTSRLARY